MSGFWVSSFGGESGGAGERVTRVVTVIRRQPSWVARLAVGAAAAVMTGVVLILLIPAVVVGVAVFLAAVGVLWVRRAFGSLFGVGRGGGAITGREGRKNVRVVVRGDDAA